MAVNLPGLRSRAVQPGVGSTGPFLTLAPVPAVGAQQPGRVQGWPDLTASNAPLEAYPATVPGPNAIPQSTGTSTAAPASTASASSAATGKTPDPAEGWVYDARIKAYYKPGSNPKAKW